MDSQFWWGVLITTVFGLPFAYCMAILANMHTPRFVQFLKTRRETKNLLKTQETRKNALQQYVRVKAFREGKRDRYPFYMILASSSVIAAIVSAALALVAVLLWDTKLYDAASAVFPTAPLLVFVAVACAFVSLICLLGIHETARQLERFADYEAELKGRWGSLDL